MKSNVDLTLNRDFKKEKPRLIKPLIMKKWYPWYKTINKVNNLENSNELIFTGDKKSRNNKRDIKKYHDGLECERCGIDFSNKPWAGEWGLCFKCSREIELEIKFDKDIILRNLK